MADLIHFWENRVNSFKNILLQTHQSDECDQIWVTRLGRGPDVKLQRPCWSPDRKCVKMAVTNSFQNLLLLTHQSECNHFGVATLGQGRDVKLRRSCWSYDRKCVKMADLVNFGEILLLQTHQSECYQIWVTTLGQGPDKLQVQWSYFSLPHHHL